MEDVGRVGRMTLEWILRMSGGKVWYKHIWLRLRTSGWSVWTR